MTGVDVFLGYQTNVLVDYYVRFVWHTPEVVFLIPRQSSLNRRVYFGSGPPQGCVGPKTAKKHFFKKVWESPETSKKAIKNIRGVCMLHSMLMCYASVETLFLNISRLMIRTGFPNPGTRDVKNLLILCVIIAQMKHPKREKILWFKSCGIYRL